MIAATAALLALAGCTSAPISVEPTVAASTAAEKPAPEVVAEVGASAGGASTLLLGHYLPTFEELRASPAVDDVVAGRVESLRYELLDDGLQAYTAMTISIDDQRTGSEERIVVWEFGGLIPVSELPAEELERLGLTGEEDGVVEYSYGREAPALDDEVLLFVYDNEGTGVFADSFGLVGGAQGRFVLDSDGDYVRSAAEEGYDTVLTAEQAREVLG